MRCAHRQVTAGLRTAGERESCCVGAVFVDPHQRVDADALGLGVLAAEFIANQAVQEHIPERHLLLLRILALSEHRVVGDEHAEHHHPGDPEEQDVVAGDENAGGIELFEFGGGVRPAHGGEGPQAGGEPGVEDVRVLHPALGGLLVRADTGDLALGAVPDRDAVAPPQLPGNGPVVHIVDPVEPARFLAGGVNLDLAVANRVTGGLGQGLDLDPPLHGQARFDGFAGALGVADAVAVGPLLGDHAALFGEAFAHLHPGFEAVHAVEFGSGVGDLAGLVHDGRHRQVVPQAEFEVVGVVRGCDLHCAGTEFGVDVVVGDDRDLAAGDRVVERGADQVPVALVLGVHRDRGIAEHGLHPGGGDNHMRLIVVERAVAQRHQFAVDVLVGDLEVGDAGLQYRRPVHQAFGTVDEPGVVELLEDGLHGAGQALVHGEAIAAPVDAVAEAAHLALDGAAGFALPIPDLVDEEFAAEVFLGLAVDGELLLHHGLGGDAGVIHAGQPQHLITLHALAAGEDVHEGVVESVAHVQVAGHIGRRQHNRVRGLGGGGVGLEVTSGYPALVHVTLYLTGIPVLGEGIGTITRVLRGCAGHREILDGRESAPTAVVPEKAEGRGFRRMRDTEGPAFEGKPTADCGASLGSISNSQVLAQMGQGRPHFVAFTLRGPHCFHDPQFSCAGGGPFHTSPGFCWHTGLFMCD